MPCSPSLIGDDFHSSQALTTLDVSHNDFGNEGGRYLLEALKFNQVQQAENWVLDILHRIILAFSRQTLTALNLRSTKIDSGVFPYLGDALKSNHVRECSFESTIELASFLFIDIEGNRSCGGMGLACGYGNRSSGKWIEGQSSKIRPTLVDHLITTVTLDRHWPHFLSRSLKLATKAPSIWVRHCRSTEWDLSLSPSEVLILSSLSADIDHT